MDRAARQVGKALLRMKLELRIEEFELGRLQELAHFAGGKAPPLRPARIFEISGIRASREMHARKQHPKLRAFGLARARDGDAREPRDERRGLTVKVSEIMVREIGDRRRARDAVSCKMR